MDLECSLSRLQKAKRSVGIPGGGKMGVGIATAVISSGDQAIVLEMASQRIPLIQGEIEARLRFLADSELIDRKHATIGQGDLIVTDALSDLADVDLVIETISENKAAKCSLFHELCAILPDYTIIGSNTSSISIAELARAVPNPERFLGIHFLSPAEVCPEVEIIEGTDTDPRIADAVTTMFQKLGRWPIRIQGNVGLINLQQASLLDTTMRMAMEQGESDEVLSRINQTTMQLGHWLVEDDLFSKIQVHDEDQDYLRCRTALVKRGHWLIDRELVLSESYVTTTAKALGRRWKVVGLFGGADLGGLRVFKELYHTLAPALELPDPLPDLLDRRVDAGHDGWEGESQHGILPCPDDLAELKATRDRYALKVIKTGRPK